MWKIFLWFCITTSQLFAISALDPSDPKWAWMDRQIEADFAFFQNGISQNMIEDVMNSRDHLSFGNNYNRFKIINGRVHGEDGDHAPKRLLELIVSLYPVPDIDVIIFTQDICWNPWELRGPVLCTCKEEGVILGALNRRRSESQKFSKVNRVCSQFLVALNTGKVFSNKVIESTRGDIVAQKSLEIGLIAKNHLSYI